MGRYAAIVLTWLFGMTMLTGQELKVMTYNIRVDFPDTSRFGWEHRKSLVAKQIASLEPDILGVQEGLHHQNVYISDQLTNYIFWGPGREGGEKGEHCAIFFRPGRFVVLDSGNIWLSEHPEQVSTGWDAMFPRICTYLKLKDLQSGDSLFILNTHFDHVGVQARRESAVLLADLAETLSGQGQIPLILIGDFNARPRSEPITVLTQILTDAGDTAKHNINGTYHGYGSEPRGDKRIDYVFFTPLHFRVLNYLVDDRKFGGMYPSDHFPVIVKLQRLK